MRSTQIYVARHGQTDYNRQQRIQGRSIDAPLNERGRRQALALSGYFHGIQLDTVVTSSLLRARQTALPLLKQQGLEAEAYEDLDEMNFGALEGRPVAELNGELQRLHNGWKNGHTTLAPKNGEHPEAVFERADRQAMQVIRKNEGRNILFVVHGRLIRILLAGWLNLGLHRMHEVEHANAAVNHLAWDGTGFEALVLNERRHLKALEN